MRQALNVLMYDRFVENRGRLADPQWLAEFLRPHCKLRRLGWRGTRLRIVQDPVEFAQFLILMASRGVRSYLEIGTSSGGSFYTADSYLRAAVPGYDRSVGYDRIDKVRDWEKYKLKFPSVEFRNVNSGRMNLRAEKFDAAFIDARHVERWVLQDFEKVRRNCPLVGFHDIVLTGSTVGDAWLKIKQRRRAWEFVNMATPAEGRCGIGVVEA